MGKPDKLKTAKTTLGAIKQACDGHNSSDVKKAQRKERQKGKKIIKSELKDYKNE